MQCYTYTLYTISDFKPLAKSKQVGRSNKKYNWLVINIFFFRRPTKRTAKIDSRLSVDSHHRSQCNCGYVKTLSNTQVKINKTFQRTIVNIFLPIIFNIYFGRSKRTVSLRRFFRYQQHMFTYLQHMFLLRNWNII